MSTHRLAVYSVQVHPRFYPNNPRSLGDIDEQGTWLGDALRPCLEGLAWQDTDDAGNVVGPVLLETRNMVDCADPSILATALQTGEVGVTSDLVQVSGNVVHRTEDDIEYIKAFVVLALPRGLKLGYLGVIIPYGRGIKLQFDQAIQTFWKAAYPDQLTLKINPVVPAGILKEAAEADAIRKVRLVKYSRSADEFESRAKWGTPETLGIVEVVIRRRGPTLLSGKPIVDYLDKRTQYDDLVEFEGAHYDDLKVEVEINGHVRTVSVSNPQIGHAITYDIDAADLDRDDRGEPTDEAFLAAALAEMPDLGPG